MTISPAVLEIARRYDIRVLISPEPLSHAYHSHLGIEVFLGAGLSLPERTVYLHQHSPIEAQLHEVAHLITHPTGCRLDMVRENFLLMQVERELARTALSKAEFSRVVSWQRESTVYDDDDLFEGGRHYWKDQELWGSGYDRAVQVGLLDAQYRPTYARPVWPKDPVEWYFEWMTYFDVIHSGSTIEELRLG